VRVSGKGSGRISVAGLLAYRTGERPHLYYRYVVHRGRRERRPLSEADYAALLTAAHQQLKGPIIVIWDNLNTHVSTRMRQFTVCPRRLADRAAAARLRLRLNAVESVWATSKPASPTTPSPPSTTSSPW
jgi:putative transposase